MIVVSQRRAAPVCCCGCNGIVDVRYVRVGPRNEPHQWCPAQRARAEAMGLSVAPERRRVVCAVVA